MDFTFKTSRETGTVIFTRVNKETKATINGKTVDCKLTSTKKDGAFFSVNLQDLHANKLLSAPNRNMEVAIKIVGEKTVGDILDKITGRVKTQVVKGRLYNGEFWSDADVAKMTYTEKVFAGIYTE